MECIKCGTQNPDGSQNCEVCSLYLPSLQFTEQGVADPIYDRYLEFRSAVKKLVDHDWTTPQFARFVDEISFKMAQKEREIRDLDIPQEAIDDFREELEVGFEGIELYNKAVLHFRQYLETEDLLLIKSGLELAWAGNEKINEARRLNRQSRQKLPDMEVDAASDAAQCP